MVTVFQPTKILVGGLGTSFIFPFSWEFHHPNWRVVIFFQRGRSTTNQKHIPLIIYYDHCWRAIQSYTHSWLVVSNIFYFPFHIWDVILPIDFHSYFSRWLLHHQPAIVTKPWITIVIPFLHLLTYAYAILIPLNHIKPITSPLLKATVIPPTRNGQSFHLYEIPSFYTPKIWPFISFMVQKLYFRILKFPLIIWLWINTYK